MAEFASKGVAGAGLGTGIAGLALGVLNSSANGNGLLGGLLGGGNQNVVSALQAENSMLKAENYSDKNAKEVYMQSLTDNRRLRDETFAYLKPLSDEAANNRVELAKGFINSAFDKSGAVEYLGFKFDKSDGEALINIMEKYKDD